MIITKWDDWNLHMHISPDQVRRWDGRQNGVNPNTFKGRIDRANLSGITEEVKAGIVTNPEDWKGRVVSINAMEIEPDTLRLRHGKIIEWRTDKKAEDCEFSQLE